MRTQTINDLENLVKIINTNEKMLWELKTNIINRLNELREIGKEIDRLKKAYGVDAKQYFPMSELGFNREVTILNNLLGSVNTSIENLRNNTWQIKRELEVLKGDR